MNILEVAVRLTPDFKQLREVTQVSCRICSSCFPVNGKNRPLHAFFQTRFGRIIAILCRSRILVAHRRNACHDLPLTTRKADERRRFHSY